MRKCFIFFLLFFICLCSDCYALDNNIIIESIKEKDKLVVDFSIGEKISYGFSTKLDYDKNTMTLVSCDGKNGYEVSYNTNYIVVENVAGSNNKTVATCTFSLAEDKTTEVVIEDITSSDYKSAVDEGNFKLNLREGVEEVILENIPDTAANMVIVYVFFGFIFIIVGAFLIYTFIFNKKMASVICLLFVLVVPFIVDAKINNLEYTQDELRTIRSTLLHEKQNDNNYDVDSDGEVTINDLIVVKVDLSSLEVNFDFKTSNKLTNSKADVYTGVTQTIKIFSKSRLREVKYCVASSGSCTPNIDLLKNKYLTTLSETFSIPQSTSTTGSVFCVRVSNMLGKSRQVCKRYMIDSVPPTMLLKSNSVTQVYPNVTKNFYDISSNITTSFGKSGGNTKCTLNGCKQNTTIGLDVYKNCNVSCTATGNNGYTITRTYTLYELDQSVPTIYAINPVIRLYNNEIASNYNFAGNVRTTFGIKGGTLGCRHSTVNGDSGTDIYRKHIVTCSANGNNGKSESVNYSIVEHDTISPSITLKAGLINIEHTAGYDYKSNISYYTFGKKGGNINCTATEPAYSNSISSIYSSRTVTCVASGNNGKSNKVTYTLNRNDYTTPTISVKQGVVRFDNSTFDSYNIKENVTALFGIKGGEVVCSKSSIQNGTSGSTLKRYYTVQCNARGKNGKNSSNVSYTIEEHDTITPSVALKNTSVSTSSDYRYYSLESMIAARHFGSKGGNASCAFEGSPTYNTASGNNEYLRITVRCDARGNNGKSSAARYSLIEVDNVTPVISFKKEKVPYTAILEQDLSSNVSNVTYGKKGGSVNCSRAVGDTKVRCIAIGKNGLSSEKYYYLY